MKNNSRLGINVVHCPVEQAIELGLRRVEICLGRGAEPEVLYQRAMEAMEKAKASKIAFSVHLPIIHPEWYPHDYLSAFYLDPDPNMQALSWRLIEENLKALKGCGSEYGVLHFCGIYTQEDRMVFENRLKEALDRLDRLACENEVKILLEYFGSNDNWWQYQQWVDALKPYKNLGVLVDTGHLHFASKWRGFDYFEALEGFEGCAEAYHFWAILNDGIYGHSYAYKTWHHISPSKEQTIESGWAFDANKVLEHLIETKRPVVLEGAPHYGGQGYFIKSIKWCHEAYQIK